MKTPSPVVVGNECEGKADKELLTMFFRNVAALKDLCEQTVYHPN